MSAKTREIDLAGREDHFERQQIAAQVIEIKTASLMGAKQRIALIRADQGAISARLPRSALLFIQSACASLETSLMQITSAFSNCDH